MTDELKPVRCGCGGEAKVYHWNHDPDIEDWYGVQCHECHINIGMTKNREPFWSAKEAIEAWNRAMGERTAKVKVVEKPNVFKCSECGQYFHSTAWGSPVAYCSRCGAKLEWNE